MGVSIGPFGPIETHLLLRLTNFKLVLCRQLFALPGDGSDKFSPDPNIQSEEEELSNIGHLAATPIFGQVSKICKWSLCCWVISDRALSWD